MTSTALPGLVVFDCDGTLVDSQHLIVEAMAGAFQACGLGPPSPEAVRHVVGLSLDAAIDRLLDGGPAEAVPALVEAYRVAFAEVRSRPHEEPLFPGVVETLDRLEAEGYLLGVATGKSLRGLERTLGRHGLAGRFVTLQTADLAAGKPSPDMLFRAIEQTGAVTDRTVMVGDTTYDMQMARNARVAAVGVAWGYHEARALHDAGADAVIESFDDLSAVLASIMEREPCA